MKYENFKEVKELVAQIEKYDKIIYELNNDFVEVIFTTKNYNIITICAWENCDNIEKTFAIKFKAELKYFYQLHVQSLVDKLSKL